MKIALTIIAHNEERNIEKCLSSALKQTLKPDEIIVVCHNCDDKTFEIASKFKEVKAIDFRGPSGVIYARMKAYDSVSPDVDVIAATDGDSLLGEKWLENLTKPFEDEKVVATGGEIYFTNSIYANMMSLSFFVFDPFFRKNFYFWGANHAFLKSAYEKSGGLDGLIEIKEKMKLNYWAEDLFLSLSLGKLGLVRFAPDSIVWTKSPKLGITGWRERGKMQDSDRIKIFKYFGLD